MSEPGPSYQDLKQERLDSYKKVWRAFLWLGWPAAVLAMWLGSRIIDGLHGRIVQLEAENKELRIAHAAPAQR
jgi:hypothetical protein